MGETRDRWACGHVRPDTITNALVGGKYVVTCERTRAHDGDHLRYGWHWPNDGGNQYDHDPVAAPPSRGTAEPETTDV